MSSSSADLVPTALLVAFLEAGQEDNLIFQNNHRAGIFKLNAFLSNNTGPSENYFYYASDLKSVYRISQSWTETTTRASVCFSCHIIDSPGAEELVFAQANYLNHTEKEILSHGKIPVLH